MPAPHPERIVYAKSVSGSEIVRYYSTRKWFLEHSPQRLIPCAPILLDAAVRFAVQWQLNNTGTIMFDQPGGVEFDKRVRAALDYAEQRAS
jgi:hypothetical protein